MYALPYLIVVPILPPPVLFYPPTYSLYYQIIRECLVSTLSCTPNQTGWIATSPTEPWIPGCDFCMRWISIPSLCLRDPLVRTLRIRFGADQEIDSRSRRLSDCFGAKGLLEFLPDFGRIVAPSSVTLAGRCHEQPVTKEWKPSRE